MDVPELLIALELISEEKGLVETLRFVLVVVVVRHSQEIRDEHLHFLLAPLNIFWSVIDSTILILGTMDCAKDKTEEEIQVLHTLRVHSNRPHEHLVVRVGFIVLNKVHCNMSVDGCVKTADELKQ